MSRLPHRLTIRTEHFHLPDICQTPALYQNGYPGEGDLKGDRFEIDSVPTLGSLMGNQRTGMCSVNCEGKSFLFPVAQPGTVL